MEVLYELLNKLESALENSSWDEVKDAVLFLKRDILSLDDGFYDYPSNDDDE